MLGNDLYAGSVASNVTARETEADAGLLIVFNCVIPSGMAQNSDSHWVYTNNPTTYPEWTKIGRTSNIANREHAYNAYTPLKEHLLIPVLECSSLEDAHYIEQATKISLSQKFEVSGEWIKCSSDIVRREIQRQYMITTAYPEFDDTNMQKLTTELRQKSVKEKNLIADAKISFWRAVKQYNNIEIKNQGKLAKQAIQFLLELPDNSSVNVFYENLCNKLAVDLTTNFDNWALSTMVDMEELDAALKLTTFFDRIEVINQITYHIFNLTDIAIPEELRSKYGAAISQTLATRFISELPGYKHHWVLFDDKVAIAPSIYDVWARNTKPKPWTEGEHQKADAYKTLRDGIRSLSYFVEANLNKRVCGKPQRCTVLRLTGEKAFPSNVLEKLKEVQELS